MRFSTAFLSSALLLVLASAQNATTTSAPTSVSLSPAQSSQASCLQSCSANDPGCRAACIVSPSGNYAQQNATIGCISDCSQGNGTAAENLAFENCQKGCLASATLAPTTPTAAATTAAPGSGSGSGSGSTGTGSGSASTTGAGQGGVSTAGSGSSTTSSAASSSTSKAAAETMRVGASLAGVVGVFAAVFAL